MNLLHLTDKAVVRPGTQGSEALVAPGNLLAPGGLPAPRGGCKRMLAWSGWVDDDPAGGMFARTAATWGPSAWAGLTAACDRLVPELAAGGAELCIRPHARHVLSDTQRCLTFLRSREGQPIRLLLDAPGLLTGGMLPMVEDHLERAFATLGGHPGVWAVLLSNVQRAAPDSDDDLLMPAPLGAGLIDPDLIVSAWRRHCPPELPCVILDTAVRSQLELLSSS